LEKRAVKKPISATIDEDLIAWIEKELEDHSKYRNKSHLIEIALENMKNGGESKKK
jgi:Arc/MetJ-type ribon-helix-helix transcriptional regulator